MIVTGLFLFLLGARAELFKHQEVLESSTHMPPRDLPYVREQVKKLAIDRCFQKGHAECPVKHFDEKVIRTRRVFKGYERNPNRSFDPIYMIESTYEFTVDVEHGATVRDVFMTGLNNEMRIMSSVRFQQETEGYSAVLELNGKTVEGFVWFGNVNNLTEVTSSAELKLENGIWGHPGEFAMRFDHGGQTYWARGRVEKTDYFFGTEITVDAFIVNREGREVGRLRLDD